MLTLKIAYGAKSPDSLRGDGAPIDVVAGLGSRARLADHALFCLDLTRRGHSHRHADARGVLDARRPSARLRSASASPARSNSRPPTDSRASTPRPPPSPIPTRGRTRAAARIAAESDALEARLRGVVDREISLEKRAAVVGALAQEAARNAPRRSAAGSAPDAVGAIQSLAPKTLGAKAPAGAPEDGAASAYAPSQPALPSGPALPRPSPDPLGRLDSAAAPQFGTLAANPNLDPSTRLAFVDRSLDRIESGQMTTLAAVDRAATETSDRDTAILADAGLDAAKLAARGPALNVGGPFVPLDVGPASSAFDRAVARASRDVAFAAKLRALMPYVPLGEPLAGEPRVTSPFGYRIDPFLGRPALHTGVDLLEAYGADIRATGAGEVVHAGPMGGYGLMVEIDHGDGLSSRYAHLSEILVSEGDAVEQGAVVGRLGSTGRATGPHLHYEVRIDGEPVDPERFLRAGQRMAAAP